MLREVKGVYRRQLYWTRKDSLLESREILALNMEIGFSDKFLK